MKSITFTIPGKPRGKTRPRFSKGGKNAYTDRATKEYEEQVAEAFRQAGGQMAGWAAMKIKAYYLIPQRTRKDILQGMAEERIRPAKKPDLDNVLKIIMDGLVGVAIEDDNQIVQVFIEKVYGQEPRVEVTLYEPKEGCELY